jgi:hypothetical protein
MVISAAEQGAAALLEGAAALHIMALLLLPDLLNMVISRMEPLQAANPEHPGSIPEPAAAVALAE